MNENPSQFDGLVQDCSISIANAHEILQSWTKPSNCSDKCLTTTVRSAIQLMGDVKFFFYCIYPSKTCNGLILRGKTIFRPKQNVLHVKSMPEMQRLQNILFAWLTYKRATLNTEIPSAAKITRQHQIEKRWASGTKRPTGLYVSKYTSQFISFCPRT